MMKRFTLLILVLSALAVVLLVYGFAQQQESDSTQMKVVWERVNVTVKTRAQYELLKGMVGECPPFDSTHGEPWEFVINQWQRKQLERKGAKVRVIAELKPDEGPNRVEFKLVREIDLKGDSVETIVFGPKKDKGSALSDIILGVKDENISIYDSNFTLINKMHLERLSFSKNLRYIGGLKFVKIPQDVTENGAYKFQLFDYTGRKLWELDRVLYYDSSPIRYSISNNGLAIELDNSSGIFTLYDQKGNEIKKIKLYTGEGDTEGQNIGGEFSEDGEYLLIVARDDYGHVFGEGKGVLLFTCDGKELWRFNLEENVGGGAISKLGNYVIVSALFWPSSTYPPDKKSTYLLSKNGALIKRYENVLGSLICFSSTEKYALFNSPYEGAFLIDLPSGGVLLKYGRLAGFHLVKSLDIDIAEDAKVFGFIACYPGTERLVMEKEGNIEVMLIGFESLKFWSDVFPSPDYRSLSPVSLRLSDDGKQMVIQIGTKIMIYQQVE